ncbi:glycosyltransferase family 4 protein [Nocardioides sp. Soil774]|uniref:glycosyltransferase family 4 protein n=1 Tax=Nocardioides sp. Soil774 TaxID=1736408 RepID=UPI0009EBF782|nr:glycosyltransferase family 4 protein [Nocardioides sp. Soil774]
MKIAMISQWFDPETGSAAIPGSVARALAARGHEVTVITGFPNYPVGKIYDGYRVKVLQREVIGNVKVVRVPMFPAHGSSSLKRAAFFLSFMLSASLWGSWFARRSDAVLVYSTSATVGVAGVVMKRVFRKPTVMYVEDLWPDSVLASGLVDGVVGRVAWFTLDRMARWGYRAADRIAVISPGMQEVLHGRGVPRERMSLVYNWADESLFHPVQPTVASDGLTMMYAGNLGDVQGIDTALRALSLVDPSRSVRLRLVGSGVAEDRLKELAVELRVDERVTFEGTRPISDMAALMSEADVQLVCLRDLPVFRATMPSKTQAILACGRPVLASAAGDAADLVARSGAGIAVAPDDAQAMAEAIDRLATMSGDELERFGASGRKFYEEELSVSVGARRLESALIGAAKPWYGAS